MKAKKQKRRKIQTKLHVADWTTKENLARVRGWFRNGLTDEEVCKKMDIGVTTLYRWKQESPELRQAIIDGKAPFDDMVEEALFKRAIGYEVTEGRINEDGTKVMIKKHIPPDTTAGIFWLKNRRKDKWRDKWDVEVTGDLPVVIVDDVKE